jgi:hypothetical protein
VQFLADGFTLPVSTLSSTVSEFWCHEKSFSTIGILVLSVLALNWRSEYLPKKAKHYTGTKLLPSNRSAVVLAKVLFTT